MRIVNYLLDDGLVLAGEYLKDCLPREKKYLYKYCNTEIQVTFVRYMHIFGSYKFFKEHAGCIYSTTNMQWQRAKFEKIEAAHKDAKEKMDLDLLEKIEKGQLNISRTKFNRQKKHK